MGVSTNPHLVMSTYVVSLPVSPCQSVFPAPVEPTHVIRHGSGRVGAFPLKSCTITREAVSERDSRAIRQSGPNISIFNGAQSGQNSRVVKTAAKGLLKITVIISSL